MILHERCHSTLLLRQRLLVLRDSSDCSLPVSLHDMFIHHAALQDLQQASPLLSPFIR